MLILLVGRLVTLIGSAAMAAVGAPWLGSGKSGR
jgi:hypothetical protein